MSDNLQDGRKSALKKSIVFADPSIESSVRVESRTSSGNTTSIKRFIIEIAKKRNEIKVELSRLSEGFNLLIFMIYVLICINWYLLGVQWFPDRVILPELECNIADFEKEGWSFYEKRNITIPKDSVYVPGCVYRDVNYTYFKFLTYEEALDYILRMKSKPPLLTCKNYTIKFDVAKEISFSREFNVYCLKKSLLATNPYGYFGIIFFGLPCGILADIYGRKPVYFCCSIILSLSAYILACSLNFVIMVIAKFFVWGSLISINLTLSIIFSEIYRHKCRTAATIASFSFMVIGVTLTSFQSIFNIIEVWRLRSLAFAISVSIFLFGIIFVPESPRYFMINKKFKKAWSCLEELGDDENSDIEDFDIPKPKLKYRIKFQLKVLTKRYLLKRVYIVLFLNGVATIFNTIYLNMRKSVVLPQYERLNIHLLLIQISLMIVTGVTSIYYSKKVLLGTYFFLLCICFFTNMTVESDVIVDVSSIAGYMFSRQINILAYTYLLEILPTSHRATSLGLYFSINHSAEAISEIFQEEMSWKENIQFYSGFYCGLCIICVLVAFMSPEHTLELPDRKQDLCVKLSLANTNFSY